MPAPAPSRAEWRPLVDKAPVSGVHFRGDRGAAYRFRISATDRALNTATIVTDPVLMPIDDRDRRLLALLARVEAGRAPGRLGPHGDATRRAAARPLGCASTALRSR